MSLRSSSLVTSGLRASGSLLAVGALAASPLAQQFNNQWLEFQQNPGTLPAPPNAISNGNIEVDFASGDLDQDAWTDLVIVRKEPWSGTGGKTNLLLMNENGALRDDTSSKASQSDVPGDQGFLTPTNDRDVALADVNNDGWLDVVTATGGALGSTPKHISHPRVYRNLGTGPGGEWLGLRHEDARYPTLLNFVSGQPNQPVFCSISAGDVTEDGFTDLYFVHYDFSNNGFTQSAVQDLNDRLVVNDGSGFFTDESQARMTTTMLFSRFGLSSAIADMNADGFADIVKNTALANPYFVSISYQDPANPGTFNIFDDFHANLSPYHISVDDLNNDGRLDITMGDDGADRYRFNMGNDPLGRVIWGPSKTFSFLAGGDDGFAGQNMIADLDNDGWNDVIQADVDTDEPGLNRRTNIFRNIGGTPGTQVVLGEEREKPQNGGWIGAVGLKEGDLRGTFDMAVFDVDRDGDKDLILGRGQGTYTWINQTVPTPLTFNTASISLATGGSQNLSLDAGDEHAGRFYVMVGSSVGTSPGVDLGNGVVLPLVPDSYLTFTLTQANQAPFLGSSGLLDSTGSAQMSISLPPGLPASLAGLDLFHACVVLDVTGSGHVVLASNPAPLNL